MILGDSATPEQVAALEEELGLNDPFLVQFGNYILGIVTRFDFGISWFTGKPIVNELLIRFPKTALLAALSVVLSAIIGIVCGVVAATKQYPYLIIWRPPCRWLVCPCPRSGWR